MLLASLVKKNETISTSKELDDLIRSRGSVNDTGVEVNNERDMMSAAAVFAAMRIVSNTVAQAPLKLYRDTGTGQPRETIRDHPAVKLLNKPNEWQSNFRFRKTLQTSLLARGISINLPIGPRSRPRQLLPIHPSRVRIERSQDDYYDITYHIKFAPNQEAVPYKQNDLIIFLGESPEGLLPVDPLTNNQNVFGLSLATEKQGARLFKNSAQFSGMFKYPKALKDDAYDRLKRSLKENYTGSDNAWGVLLLEDGLDWVKTGLTAEESQFLETRKFQVGEVARIFGVPPHLLFELDRATFNNIEHLSLEFLKFFIQPFWEEIEQRLTLALLNRREREEGHYFEHDPSRLLRGDTAAITDREVQHVVNGIRTPNEVRLDHDWEPLEGGDELRPAPNASPDAGDEETEPAEPPEIEEDEA